MVDEKFPSKVLYGKTVISKSGSKFGEVGDLIFEVKSGELLYIVLKKPTEHVEKLNADRDEEGNYLIPFNAVIAIGDFIVINEDEII